MTDAYTYIGKPSDPTYTRVGFEGRQMYDDASVMFDDLAVFYDSVNQSAYTSVSKPTGEQVVDVGTSTGLLIPPTYPPGFEEGQYTFISKPTT